MTIRRYFLNNRFTTVMRLASLSCLISLFASKAIAAAPEAPILTVSTESLQLSISWTAVADAQAYTLYYAPAPYTGPETIGNVSMLIETSLSAQLQLGDSYLVAVAAYNADGEGEASNVETFTISADDVSETFSLSSAAIANGELLEAYKCEAKVDNIEASIPLSWSNVPEATTSLIITMHHYPNPADETLENGYLKANSYLSLWGIDPLLSEIGYAEADQGNWYIGSNKDSTAISYTSPCSPTAGSHDYVLTLYALAESPASLPNMDSIEISYAQLIEAITTVEVIATAVIEFADVNE